MKYLKNPAYRLKIIEFGDENDEKNGVNIEFLHKPDDRKNKLVMVLINECFSLNFHS